MTFYLTQYTTNTPVPKNGTFVVAYPAGTVQATYTGGTAHEMFALQTLFVAPTDFTVAFGATTITVTYLRETTLPAGTEVDLQFATADASNAADGLTKLTGALGAANDAMTAVAAATAATTDATAASLASVNTAITAVNNNNNLADLQAKVNAIIDALKA